MEKGRIYIVPTPIGNMEDMTYRAIETLKNVDYVLAEDTRIAGRLLKYFEIENKLVSYYKDVEKKKTEKILEDINAGKDVAIISDAGTPGISDPGMYIIKEAIKEGIEIITLPGATAFVPAIVNSGLGEGRFLFYGFLNPKEKKRKEELEEILKKDVPVVIYESPKRIKSTLMIIQKIDPEKKVSVSREISKMYETTYRGRAEEMVEKIIEKGEFVLVIDAAKNENVEGFKEMDIKDHYKFYEMKGLEKKEIIKQIANDLRCHKSEIYKIFM